MISVQNLQMLRYKIIIVMLFCPFSAASEDASFLKTTKKTKAKKKPKNTISIFDEDSTNIFGSPLNPT